MITASMPAAAGDQRRDEAPGATGEGDGSNGMGGSAFFVTTAWSADSCFLALSCARHDDAAHTHGPIRTREPLH